MLYGKVLLAPAGLLIPLADRCPGLALFLLGSITMVAGIIAGNIVWTGFTQARYPARVYVNQSTAWPRLILDDDRVVGFVMGNFDPDCEIAAFQSGIWRLNVAAGEQGRGYGAFAVRQVAEEARRLGFGRITVLWIPGDGGPEGFYRRQGFRPTGEEMDGEIVGELLL